MGANGGFGANGGLGERDDILRFTRQCLFRFRVRVHHDFRSRTGDTAGKRARQQTERSDFKKSNHLKRESIGEMKNFPVRKRRWVPNASHRNVFLNNVTDSANDVGDVSAHMDVLLGDVNASGRTDSGDVTAVRNRTVSVPDQQTFCFDVNASGAAASIPAMSP